MADFEDRLRTELTRRAGELTVSEDLPERIHGRVRRRRRQQLSVAGALSAVVVAVVVGLLLVRSPGGDDRLETATGRRPTTTTTEPATTTDSRTTAPAGGDTPPPEATTTTTTVARPPETSPPSTPGTSPTGTSPPGTSPTSAPPDLKPPDSQEPTAGACATASGPVAEVTLNVDVPSPRCTNVRADQSLRVTNNTDQTVSVALADYSATLPPGASRGLGGAFGDYLQPGVHRITVSLYGGSGPEIDLDP
jgi:hypothetical protein